MRLDFNMLWVEDQPDNVKPQEQKIARQIRKQGFKLQTQFAKSVTEAKGFLGSDTYGDHIDLILMDYDLGAGPKGDAGLVAVRNAFEYKDLVFYSAQSLDLTGLVGKKHIQGVFCTTREDLTETVIGLFDTLVKKVIDIDHSRGIVMGASSDIDHLVNACLHHSFEQGDEEHKQKALGFVGKRMKEIRKSFEKAAAIVDAVKHVKDLAANHGVYTSMHRLNLLRKMLESGGKHADECDAMKTYETVTVPLRNALAHVRVQRNGFSRKLVDSKGNELTGDQMKQLRIDLLNNHELFENLENSLNPKNSIK